MRIRVWQGWRAVHGGKDVSKFSWVEFDGELLGSFVVEVDEDREDELSFYRTNDGRIVVAEHRFGDWEKGAVDYGVVSVYADLNDAARCGWYEHLVRIGAYSAPTQALEEWLNQFEEEEGEKE